MKLTNFKFISNIMPNQKLPPGQYTVNTWPVLTAGRFTEVDVDHADDWILEISGLVENPVTLTLKELKALNNTSENIDFHCVTTWSMLGTNWKGISWSDIEKLVKPSSEAKYVLQYSNDELGYTTGTDIEELRKPHVMIGFEHDGKPIPSQHGGPIRIINPNLYAYKSAKWLKKLEFLPAQKLGYWEQLGYSEQADPWKEQRYTEDDV
jgi:DMSO/TMAO reductase YedYZ molybdopterin-dependent catalytic subunit